MGRTIAIGDVHGCTDLLNCLLETLAVSDDDQVVFLGDYVDRGPDAPGVVERLIRFAGEHSGTVFLRGNHDAMLLNFLGLEPEGYGDSYLLAENGGTPTLEQYGCAAQDIRVCRDMPGSAEAAEAKQRFLRLIPQEHLAFLKRTQLFHKTEDNLFVHAGYNTRKRWNEQTQDDLLWIREEFVNFPHRLPQTVIYGHTATSELGFKPRIDWKKRKVGIDTGAAYGGSLTALIMPDRGFVSATATQPPRR